MKTMLLLLALAGAGTLLWALASFWTRSKPGDGERFSSVTTEMPAALRNAKLWAKEKSIACRTPRRLHGKLDEAFEVQEGLLVVSETKSRERPVIHRSDVIQNSAYAMTLAKSSGVNVSGTGYIRLITPQGNRFVPVELMSEQDLIRIYDKFKRIKGGQEAGDRCGKAGLCAKCEYRKECDSM